MPPLDQGRRIPGRHARGGDGRYNSFVALQFTAVYQKVPEGYIGFVEELPGANTQGDTLDATRRNLHEAVALILEANRQSTEAFVVGDKIIREPLTAA